MREGFRSARMMQHETQLENRNGKSDGGVRSRLIRRICIIITAGQQYRKGSSERTLN